VAECYELTRYALRHGPQQERLDRFLREVALPAWRRCGLPPVGVFESVLGEPVPTVYTLLRHTGPESVLAVRNRLANDGAFQAAAAFFHAPPAGDPSFGRMESTLLTAFDGLPELAPPPGAGLGQPRLFELRRYESHSQAALQAKVAMFDRAEIAIFRRVGLTPVFFGECLVGAHQPNLTYLLVFRDVVERDERWAAFRQDPEWQRLVNTPGLTNPEIVCNVTSVLLRPAACSAI
jgi:hypothetical protein